MSFPFTLLPVRSYSTLNAKLLEVLKKMPKDPKHIAEAQQQRRKIKEKSSKYSPGRVTLQVLGTGAPGSPKSLYVFSDQSRYLFNCGEGTQRLAHEHKMRLAKLEHIFITQPVWANLGGLPGAALTIQDVGVPQITLHGPPGLDELFVATRRFIILKNLEIAVSECTADSTFEDNVLKISYLPLTSNQTAKASRESSPIPEDTTDYYSHESSGLRQPPQLVSHDSQAYLQSVRRTSMAYICQLQPRPGALCLDKCVKLGVPSGPLLGRLKSGENVVLPNGSTVRAADVCDPDDPGPIFLIIDCPSADFIDSLLDNPKWGRYQASATCDDELAAVVVHFTPQGVLEDERYRKWIDLFSPSTQHLILNEQNSCMGSLAVHRIQHKLNLLSSDFFPLLGDRGTKSELSIGGGSPKIKRFKSEELLEASCDDLRVDSSTKSFVPGLLYANTLCNYLLRPKKGFDKSGELKLSPDEFVEETMAIEGFAEVLHDTKQLIADKRRELRIRDYPKIVFLGTGSSIPNKTRNTSGILLEIE